MKKEHAGSAAQVPQRLSDKLPPSFLSSLLSSSLETISPMCSAKIKPATMATSQNEPSFIY